MTATADTATWWAKRWLDRATSADKAAMRALLDADKSTETINKEEQIDETD